MNPLGSQMFTRTDFDVPQQSSSCGMVEISWFHRIYWGTKLWRWCGVTLNWLRMMWQLHIEKPVRWMGGDCNYL